MPVQRFAPMTKDFATFDCDAHVTEPPKIWERAVEEFEQTGEVSADIALTLLDAQGERGIFADPKHLDELRARVITEVPPEVADAAAEPQFAPASAPEPDHAASAPPGFSLRRRCASRPRRGTGGC